jgi:hypothetical protein
VGLERGPLSLLSTNEGLLRRNNSGSGLESREYDRADHATPSIRKKLALTLPTSGGHSVGIVRSRTKATEFSYVQNVNNFSPPCLIFFCSYPNATRWRRWRKKELKVVTMFKSLGVKRNSQFQAEISTEEAT